MIQEKAFPNGKASFYRKRYLSATMKCGYVTFLSLNKKVTKEVSQRGATKMRPLWKPPPPRHPTPENVPIFRCLPRETCRLLIFRCSKIGTFLNTGRRCGGWILKEGAFSKRLLKSPSFGTFLGEARKVHYQSPGYFALQKFSTGAVECGEILCGKLSKFSHPKFLPQSLWKSSSFHTSACG